MCDSIIARQAGGKPQQDDPHPTPERLDAKFLIKLLKKCPCLVKCA